MNQAVFWLGPNIAVSEEGNQAITQSFHGECTQAYREQRLLRAIDQRQKHTIHPYEQATFHRYWHWPQQLDLGQDPLDTESTLVNVLFREIGRNR